MTEQVASYRRMLRSTSIIGGASVLNILIGLIRTKVLAILLGPAGVGLVSLYVSLMSTASAVASMGVGMVGTRQVAEAAGQDDAEALAVVKRAMQLGTLFLSVMGALLVWLMRDTLALHVLGDVKHSGVVAWLSLGVALSVAAASQGAMLQGLRRIGDMARVSVYGSALNTVLGLALLWRWGGDSLVAYVLFGPLISFILGRWYVSRLPKVSNQKISMQELAQQWGMLLRLGVPFMAAGLVATLVQLWIRVEVGNTLGEDALGHFQASWMISMQYIGFVLGAMGADYYPRLTALINDHQAATRLVNEQTQIGLLLSAPVFIAMLGVTPWVIHLLYSAEFLPAVEILRWQVLGDVLKVASWPLGFIILAAGAGKTYFWSETSAFLLMGGLVAVFTSVLGLKITGIAFLACYMLYLPVVYWLAKRRIGFCWRPEVRNLLLTVFLMSVVTAILSSLYWWGAIVAVGSSFAFACYSLLKIASMSDPGRLAGVALKAQRVTEKLLRFIKLKP